MEDRNRIGVTILASALTALIVILLLVGLVAANRQKIGAYLLAGGSQRQGSSQTIATPEGQSSVVQAVQKSNPAVVSIIVTKDVSVVERYRSPFDYFFGAPQQGQGGTRQQEIGGGSGFLVSADGLIVPISMLS